MMENKDLERGREFYRGLVGEKSEENLKKNSNQLFPVIRNEEVDITASFGLENLIQRKSTHNYSVNGGTITNNNLAERYKPDFVDGLAAFLKKELENVYISAKHHEAWNFEILRILGRRRPFLNRERLIVETPNYGIIRRLNDGDSGTKLETYSISVDDKNISEKLAKFCSLYKDREVSDSINRWIIQKDINHHLYLCCTTDEKGRYIHYFKNEKKWHRDFRRGFKIFPGDKLFEGLRTFSWFVN